jgi:hypothetical protein
VDSGAGDEFERPFVGEPNEAEQEVDDLENGEGLYSAIEVLGEEIPEDFGPEEAFDCGGDLVWGGRVSWGFMAREGCSRSSQVELDKTRIEAPDVIKKWDTGIRLEGNVQMLAVRMMRRAQWFLMSFPMATVESERTIDRSGGNSVWVLNY